jgi:hypothetical protein
MKSNINKITLLAVASLFLTSLASGSLLASPRVDSYIRLIRDRTNRIELWYQQPLPPDKRKSLATYGPEDVFPTQADDKQPKQRNRRVGTRPTSANRSAAKPAQVITPVVTPTPVAPEPSPSPLATTATVDPTTTPSATPAAAVAALAQDDAMQQPGTRMSLQNLAILTILVTSALVFVLLKLMAKFREGSG